MAISIGDLLKWGICVKSAKSVCLAIFILAIILIYRKHIQHGQVIIRSGNGNYLVPGRISDLKTSEPKPLNKIEEIILGHYDKENLPKRKRRTRKVHSKQGIRSPDVIKLPVV